MGNHRILIRNDKKRGRRLSYLGNQCSLGLFENDGLAFVFLDAHLYQPPSQVERGAPIGLHNFVSFNNISNILRFCMRNYRVIIGKCG